MQNKGIVIVTAVLLTLASIFYLSFSFATRYYDSKAEAIKDPIAQQDYKDSVKYLGIYSYQKCLETQIGLGLDLKGGMNVILEISVPDVLETLADHKTDAFFVKAMEEAKKEEETSQGDFISLFVKSFKKYAAGHRLAEIFATQQLQGKISPNSSDSEVEKVLREEVKNAIDNSFNVVRTRIDKFGVVQPNIQKLEGQEGRIMIVPYLVQLDQRLANGETTADTTAVADTAKVAKAAEPKLELNANKKGNAKLNVTDEAKIAEAKRAHPLLSMLQTTGNGALALVGFASVRDTAEINKAIYSATAKQVLPSDLKLMWSAKPEDRIKAKNVYGLYAIKVTTANGRAPLEGDVITDAKDQFNSVTGAPEV